VSVFVDRLSGLVAPVLADLGLDLYDLEFAGGQLRVVIDRPGGIDLEAIAEATRLISRELDAADPIPGRYQLEVTSPGLERNLRTPAHFQGAVGTTVKVRVRVAFRDGTSKDVDYTGAAIRWSDTWEKWGEPPAKSTVVCTDADRKRIEDQIVAYMKAAPAEPAKNAPAKK